MGGRGPYAAGNNVAYTYETVGKIEGIKVLEKLNKENSRSLPEEAHSANAYILTRPNGDFKQYREFNDDKTAKFDIDFHPEPKITGNRTPVYHIHFYINGKRDDLGRMLTDVELQNYKKYFTGRIR